MLFFCLDLFFFFFNDTATPEIYPLPLHDALPIWDHQASGLLATEAFDLAGDPAAFPEQLAGPTKRLEPLLENLRPWQPKKIYYFPDADREDIFRGKGPDYSVKEISKSGKQPYWRMALDSFRAHQTQAKSFLDKIAQMDEAQIQKMADRKSVVEGKR